MGILFTLSPRSVLRLAPCRDLQVCWLVTEDVDPIYETITDEMQLSARSIITILREIHVENAEQRQRAGYTNQGVGEDVRRIKIDYVENPQQPLSFL